MDNLTERVQAISANITGLTSDISSDLQDLETAKRSKVTKYESTKRKLKLSAEQFHHYLSEIDCLFEYLCDDQLETIIVGNATSNVAPGNASETTPGNASESETTPENTSETTQENALDLLLESVDRAKTSHEKFQTICKEAEEKCRKGAQQCEAYTVVTDKKKSKRLKSGRNLIINQLLFAIGGLITVITLISVLAKGEVSFNATTASSLIVALLVSGITVTAAIVIAVVLIYKRHRYKDTAKHFVQMENGFKGIDEQIVNLRQVLLSELHSEVLIIETLLKSCKEIIRIPNEGNKSVLKINIKIMAAKGKKYKDTSEELHMKLKEFFAMKHLSPKKSKKEQHPPPIIGKPKKAIIESAPPRSKTRILNKGDFELHDRLLEEPPSPPSDMAQQDNL